jgi:hypothetical protein
MLFEMRKCQSTMEGITDLQEVIGVVAASRLNVRNLRASSVAYGSTMLRKRGSEGMIQLASGMMKVMARILVSKLGSDWGERIMLRAGDSDSWLTRTVGLSMILVTHTTLFRTWSARQSIGAVLSETS